MGKKQNKPPLFCVYIFLTVATFFIYAQVKNYDFIKMDDGKYVYENRLVQTGLTLQNIKWAFTAGHCSNWHPLTWMSHMLDCQLFGLNPAGHHLVNVTFHIANTLLLFAILNAMTGGLWQSAFVAAAFALHPLHVESVAWIAERKDVLSTFFWLLTIAAYIRYTRKLSVPWYLLTLFLFALGLMSKPMLVTLPFTLLLLDYWPLDRYKQPAVKNPKKQPLTLYRLILEKIPFIALSIASSITTYLVQQKGGAIATTETFAIKIRIANAIISYIRYLNKMIWPNGLAIFYPFDNTRLPLIQALAAAILISAITILVFRLAKTHRYLPVGWLWYLGTLVPVIGLVQVGAQSSADRYTYVPSIGLFIIAAWGLTELSKYWPQKKTILWSLSIAAIAAMSFRTYFQIQYWRDSLTIFNHTIGITQRNGAIYCNLSAVYLKLGQIDKGIEAAQEALKIDNNYFEAFNNLSIAYTNKGRYQEAAEYALQTIKLRPDIPEGYSNLAAAYNQLKRYKEAILNLQKAISIEPELPTLHYNLAIAYYQDGQYQGAIKESKKVIELDPKHAAAYQILALTYGTLNRHQDAISVYQKAIQLKPDYAQAYYNLGIAYLAIGDKKSASEQYDTLKQIHPKLAEMLLENINKTTSP